MSDSKVVIPSQVGPASWVQREVYLGGQASSGLLPVGVGLGWLWQRLHTVSIIRAMWAYPAPTSQAWAPLAPGPPSQLSDSIPWGGEFVFPWDRDPWEPVSFRSQAPCGVCRFFCWEISEFLLHGACLGPTSVLGAWLKQKAQKHMAQLGCRIYIQGQNCVIRTPREFIRLFIRNFIA